MITHATQSISSGQLISYYGHLDGSTLHDWVTYEGMPVSQGQQIALSDNSGLHNSCIDGAHLHFAMHDNATDPFVTGVKHFPEPMLGPNGTTYSNFGAYGLGHGPSLRYTSTLPLPHPMQPVGTVTFFDTTVTPNVQRVNAFYLGSDGKAYINFLYGGTWYWLPGSSPSGVTLSGGAGAVTWWDTPVTPNVQRVNAFYFGGDGNAYIYFYYAGAYQWSSGLHPSGHNIIGGAGAVQYWVNSTLAVNAFLLADDGNAYIEYYYNNSWYLSDGRHPSGVNLISGAGAHEWWDSDQHAIRVNAHFVGDNGGNAYREYYDGTNWQFAAGSKPPGVTITQIVGATNLWAGVLHTYSFAIGSDGYAYRSSYAAVDDSGSWSARSQPPSATSLVGGAGAASWVDSAQQAAAFFQGADGSVYRQSYSLIGGTWSFDAGQKPSSGVYMAGGIGPVAYVYNGVQTVNVFLLGTDGQPYIEWLHNYWGLTGETQQPAFALLG